ncbi:FAD-dependent oxidoreductase [Cupriavidus metallidurans]|uniref:FAD-dependent oxidoreductase n=1 Tax=Cupriavidus metallidurans TaxID=119219 RepID=UPI001CCD6AE9|nr:FAD-dependent oxidoreductase [Cupriavidus metallidurans]UBM09370.1 FAD-dependent oxidoreductase [Cupriavidus metallidurans]
MANAVENVLIIGGGFSGMAAAIELRKLGVAVDVVEIDPGWRSYGAGISLGGATFRAFRQLGILDEFLKRGHAADGVDLALANGTPVGSLPTPRIAGPDVPGGGAIMRPALAEILATATKDSGAEVRLGCTFTAIEQDDSSVRVSFTDGQVRRYDLVIGADGLNSAVRSHVFPAAPVPTYTGQGVWRAVLPRPAWANNAKMWIGPHLKVGINPVSKEEMYLFLTEDRPSNGWVDPNTFLAALRDLLAEFPAPEVTELRDALTPESQIVYRPLEGLLVDRPWYSGRVVLIGDTVHATTPHLASGACIGIEDALVLADEIAANETLPKALAAFQGRRWERCRMVVHNSGRLGDIEISGGDKEEHARIMRESLIALAGPI